ncbi:MAG: hypothetical protein K0R15_1788 [Clostridiales bacterium]|jgi:uncharacterized membrane protein|nr:hypothetical protein [Clostridiales bacterium]
MFCNNCGKELKDDAKFCDGCGRSTEPQNNPQPVPTQNVPPQPVPTQNVPPQPVPPQPVPAQSVLPQNQQQAPAQNVPPQYGQPQYSQPQYSQPQYVPPQYGQQQYGQQQNTQQQYPQPPYKPVQGNEQENKVIFILAYLGILFFLPLVSCPNSKIGRFHANQGLVLLITSIVGQIVLTIISSIVSWRLWAVMSMLYTIWGIVIFVLVIIGMINANKNELKPLPVIGGIKLIK